jgi:hypothetical protein
MGHYKQQSGRRDSALNLGATLHTAFTPTGVQPSRRLAGGGRLSGKAVKRIAVKTRQ